MKWVETGLRKGTKKPKICRDMFIANSRGIFNLCEVKNAKMVARKVIDKETAEAMIAEHSLVATGSIFHGCYTYRTQKSTDLVSSLLGT